MQPGEFNGQHSYSGQTANIIDEEVKRIANEGMQQAKEIIEAHREQHKVIAEALLEHETLDEKQILSLYKTGKMPAENEDEFPSEKAATFEEAKQAVERREAKKQLAEKDEEHKETEVFYPHESDEDSDKKDE